MKRRVSKNKSKAKPHRFAEFIYNDCLDLTLQGLTDEDIPELSQFLLERPFITTLNLSLNHIGDQGIAHFAERNMTVSFLNFSGNNVSDDGLVVFAYKNQTVKQVNFSHNLISEKGITSFAKINEICYSSQFSTMMLH
jgi:uncharacterized membrane protein